jgi:PAS domain S-box-containing protein
MPSELRNGHALTERRTDKLGGARAAAALSRYRRARTRTREDATPMSLSMSLPSSPAALAERSDAADVADASGGDPSWRRWADALPDVCVWLDPHSGRIIDCNRAMFGTLGYTRSEVCGWPLHTFAEPRHLELAAGTWQRLARGDVLRDADCTLRARNGFELAVSATSQPVADVDGRVIASLVVWRDITDRHKRQQSLRARKRQLKSLAYELVATDSREAARSGQRIQNDVVALLARAQTRIRQLGKPDGASLGEIEVLLSRATIAARGEAALLSAGDPGDGTLQGAIERLARAVTREGPLIARVEGQLPPTLELPLPMRSVLMRVLQELVLNARRHAQARQLWIRLQLDENRLDIAVGDDGIGFDVTRLPSSTDADGGSGLYSAEARMQAIGGRLVLQSRPGRGTRAVASVPVIAEAPPSTVS